MITELAPAPLPWPGTVSAIRRRAPPRPRRRRRRRGDHHHDDHRDCQSVALAGPGPARVTRTVLKLQIMIMISLKLRLADKFPILSVCVTSPSHESEHGIRLKRRSTSDCPALLA